MCLVYDALYRNYTCQGSLLNAAPGTLYGPLILYALPYSAYRAFMTASNGTINFNPLSVAR